MSDKPKQDFHIDKIFPEINDLKRKNKKLTKAFEEVILDNHSLRDTNEFLSKNRCRAYLWLQ
jgi:hypothetical protein